MSQKFLITWLLRNLNRSNNNRNYSDYGANIKWVSSQFVRLNRNDSTLKCWKCGVERMNLSDLFCEACHTIQNPNEKRNYFKVFNLDVTYDVNQSILRDSYRRMQSVLHPDKFSNKSEIEKQISAEYSSLVNEAYKTLQTPINRAMHLLSLNNEAIAEDNKADNPEFLMEMMELNEEIDEANSPLKLKTLREKNNEMLSLCSNEVSDYFKQNKIKDAKDAIIKMKYYTALSKRINDLMRERGIVD